MADVAGKGKISVPVWALVTFSLSILVGGAGWIDKGIKARSDADTATINQDIVQLKHEQDQQNAIIASDTMAISDIKTSLSAINEQNKQNATYLLELIKRLK